jgi:CRP/FNR family cyclic AMP-dependent transcriptional regulator
MEPRPFDILAGSALFGGIPPRRLESLLPSLRRREFERGVCLFQEGDPASQLYIILSGQVQISRTHPTGDELVLAVLGPGELFGELAVLKDGALRSADASALQVTRCLTLDRSALNSFLDGQPELRRHLVSALVDALLRRDEALVSIASLDVPGRVARVLLDLADRHGMPTEDGRLISLRLHQRTLAGMVAASREKVNRALVSFADVGMIRQHQGCIVILKPLQLRRRALLGGQ